MIMLTLIFAVLCLISNALAFFETVSPTVSQQAQTNLSCTAMETPCGMGCCPFENGVCCIDGFECCRQGQTCIPYIGMCLGLETRENSDPALVSGKSTPIRNLVTSCPSGTTECSPGKCCIFEDAVCCSDGQHCCPSGYRCDVSKGECLKDSRNDLDSTPSAFLGTETSLPQQKIFNKPSHKSCPGGTRMCPSYASCCLNDQGAWGCCPNPALSGMYRAGGGECCNTIFGYMCCPNDYPYCTIFGCHN